MSAHGQEECAECRLSGIVKLMLPDTGVSIRPLRTFRDDSGVTHIHENEPMLVSYRCSNGHHLTRIEVVTCPGCGWRHGEEE